MTCFSTFAEAIVAEEISGNTFKIKIEKPIVKVSCKVAGLRKDAAANYYRIQNEVEKQESKKAFTWHLKHIEMDRIELCLTSS